MFKLESTKRKEEAAKAPENQPIMKDGEKVNIRRLNKKEQEDNNLATLAKGITSIKELIAPPSIELKHTTYLRVGDKWVKSYYMQGYPKYVNVTWMDRIYNANSDIDVSMYIEPINTGQALQEITNHITSLDAELEMDRQAGRIKDQTKLQAQIGNLMRQKVKLEQSVDNLFATQLFINLYANSKNEMEAEDRTIKEFFGGRQAKVEPLYMREDKAFKSAMPYGKTYITDEKRNANTGQLTAMLPFYNSEINHVKGVTFGVNRMTGNDISVDFYDRNKLFNSNINVFGSSGSGKTFLVSLLTLRSVLRGIRTVIIDPENEYFPITQAMGGADFEISASSNDIPNPFDVEEEEYLNKKTGELDTKFDLNAKIQDLMNLISIMYPNIQDSQKAVTMHALQDMYNSRGFHNNDVRTLYVEGNSTFDPNTQQIRLSKQKKEMPTFMDFWQTLSAEASQANVNQDELRSEISVLEQFTRNQAMGLFDRHTPERLRNYRDMPIITFDISRLEDQILRPIGLFVVLQWAWENFGKKHFGIRKRVVIDEAWMFLNQNFAGWRYSSSMLETMSRRFRKQNGGLLCASQNFKEFTASRSGRAVLTNAFTTIFLRENDVDYRECARFFNLTAGEASSLVGASKGQFLIRIGEQSASGIVTNYNRYEFKLIKAGEIKVPTQEQ